MLLGLIPDCPLECVTAVGNAAGDGARIALLNHHKREEAAHFARWVTYIETASRLSPEQLRQVRRGELTLAELKPVPETPKPPTTVGDVVAWWLTASEAEHAAVVGSVGVTSAWDAIAPHLD